MLSGRVDLDCDFRLSVGWLSLIVIWIVMLIVVGRVCWEDWSGWLIGRIDWDGDLDGGLEWLSWIAIWIVFWIVLWRVDSGADWDG